jgi:hypothetical protein
VRINVGALAIDEFGPVLDERLVMLVAGERWRVRFTERAERRETRRKDDDKAQLFHKDKQSTQFREGVKIKLPAASLTRSLQHQVDEQVDDEDEGRVLAGEGVESVPQVSA